MQDEDTKQILIDSIPNTPLRFTGKTLGEGSTKTPNSTHWTIVTISQTMGGRFVATVENRTQWEGEQNFCDAKSFASAEEVIVFLRDEEGHIGGASQEALEKAAAACDAFKAVYVQHVE